MYVFWHSGKVIEIPLDMHTRLYQLCVTSMYPFPFKLSSSHSILLIRFYIVEIPFLHVSISIKVYCHFCVCFDFTSFRLGIVLSLFFLSLTQSTLIHKYVYMHV